MGYVKNEIVEIQSVLCNDCNGAAFVMLFDNGDTEVLACDCKDEQNGYFVFGKEAE